MWVIFVLEPAGLLGACNPGLQARMYSTTSTSTSKKSHAECILRAYCLVLMFKFKTLVALQFRRQPKLVTTFHQIPLIRYYWLKQLVVYRLGCHPEKEKQRKE